MKRSKRLGRRYIRTFSDALRAAFMRPVFRERVVASITQRNTLLAQLLGEK